MLVPNWSSSHSQPSRRLVSQLFVPAPMAQSACRAHASNRFTSTLMAAISATATQGRCGGGVHGGGAESGICAAVGTGATSGHPATSATSSGTRGGGMEPTYAPGAARASDATGAPVAGPRAGGGIFEAHARFAQVATRAPPPRESALRRARPLPGGGRVRGAAPARRRGPRLDRPSAADNISPTRSPAYICYYYDGPGGIPPRPHAATIP
jgi:hypothetical protein